MSQELSGYRVMVVEDEYFLAEEIGFLLGETGAEVVGPLGTLQDGLDQVRRGGFELAVLDINLGGDLAYPIADALDARGIPFLFATAYHWREMPEAYRGRPRVEKPYGARALIACLTAIAREVQRPV